MSTPADVIDDRDHHRFVYAEDGVEAQLVYRVDGSRLVLEHTEVPDSMGGRGVGGKLVRAAIERAGSAGEIIAPWCPYTRRWLTEHPDDARRVAIDWSDPPDA